MSTSYAAEVEFEDDEDQVGIGMVEGELEQEHDDEGTAIASDTGNLILLVTIGAIVASVGYTGFKLLKTKRPAISKP